MADFLFRVQPDKCNGGQITFRDPLEIRFFKEHIGDTITVICPGCGKEIKTRIPSLYD